MTLTALLTLGLTLGAAQAHDGVVTSSHELHEALARIEALEARLEEAEKRLDTPAALPTTGGLVSQTNGAVHIATNASVEEAVAFRAPVQVHGRVRGPAVAFGGDVVVHAGGQVDGDAVAFGGEVRVQEGGQVLGERVTLGPPSPMAWRAGASEPGHSPWFLTRWLGLLLATVGTAVLVAGLFPTHLTHIALTLHERPLRAGLSGLLATGLALLGALLLTLTLVGIPLALLLLMLLTLIWGLGLIGLCRLVAESLPLRAGARQRYQGFLLGVAALTSASTLLPGGPLLLALLGLFGAGAVVQTRLGTQPVN